MARATIYMLDKFRLVYSLKKQNILFVEDNKGKMRVWIRVGKKVKNFKPEMQ